VINKTNNKTWQWVEENGLRKKKLVKQEKGDNWAIRKPLHKDTVSGKVNFSAPKGKIATATRVSLSEITNQKHILKITDKNIRETILPNHLKNYIDSKGDIQFDRAFDADGIDALNKNIQKLNNDVPHKPIYKVRQYEIGSKFSVAETGTKSTKYVEAAKGTNLFFAIYWNEQKRERNYETVPLNEVIEHQKQVAHLPKTQRTPIAVTPEKGTFMFTLSPYDLVYVPTDEELEKSNLVDFNNLIAGQANRIMSVNDFTGVTCYFTPNALAKAITSKEVDSSFDSKTAKLNGVSIKDRCWKLQVDRLGNVKILKS